MEFGPDVVVVVVDATTVDVATIDAMLVVATIDTLI